MIGDKQTQSAEGSATALQAGRDIHVYGLSASDVYEICALCLRENFPKLKEEALRIAENNVKDFAEILQKRLTDTFSSIAIEKLKDPDVQAAINDAVQASARKGISANPQVLTTLISERVAKNSDAFKDIVLSEAVRIVPRLTAQQIALLSFVHFVCSMRYPSLISIKDLELVGQAALRFSSAGFGLSDSQKQHLQYAGVASVNNILSGDIFDIQCKEYARFGLAGGVAFKEELARYAPSYSRLLEQFSQENLFAIHLTSVGQAIALAHASNYSGSMDYSIWIK